MLHALREKYCGKFTVAHYETDTEKFLELWDQGKPVASLHYKYGTWEVSVHGHPYGYYPAFNEAVKAFEGIVDKEVKR